jgi:hypothetical protein
MEGGKRRAPSGEGQVEEGRCVDEECSPTGGKVIHAEKTHNRRKGDVMSVDKWFKGIGEGIEDVGKKL